MVGVERILGWGKRFESKFWSILAVCSPVLSTILSACRVITPSLLTNYESKYSKGKSLA